MLIFPGQGSQYKGIGRDLIEESDRVKDVYYKASSTLGYDIAELSFKDRNNEINLTRFTQPVLLTHQIACYEYFREISDHDLNPKLLGGHSLGEYTALIISGSISFEEGLALVSKRGELMSKHGSGSMLAMPFERLEAEDLIGQFNCEVATINQLQQTVVGGSDQDINSLAESIAIDFPRKRTVKLKTEGAFHTSLMNQAAEEFKGFLQGINFNEMNSPVLSNFSADIHNQDGSESNDLLYNQLFQPVNWLGCMETAAKLEIDTIIEFGGGLGEGSLPSDKRPNLEGITKKIFRTLKHDITYHPAINTSTISVSAKTL